MLDALQTAPDTGFQTVTVELVPPELLALPDRRERRFLERDLAAAVIDDYLRRLASQGSRSRRLLGRLCRTLLRRRAYHRLGFARLSDYTRERLGVSASEVRGLAAVSDRLEQLPTVADAFESGKISWSKVRLLVAVCTRETEEGWLELARIRTVRSLKQAIEAAAREGDVARRPGMWPDLRETLDEVDGRIGGEPAVRFRLRCPKRIVPLWRRAVELARRMLGSDGSMAEVADAVAAEGASALEPTEAGIDMTPDGAVLSVGIEGTAARGCDDSSEAFPRADWAAIVEAAPAEIEALTAGADFLDPFELDERLRLVTRAMQRIDWQMGRLLHMLFRLRLHRLLGFSSSAEYAQERLGISPRKSRSLVSLDRRACDAMELGEAYRRGRLSWLRALALLPVVAEGNAAAWVERAGEVTLRRLLEEVEWALEIRDAEGGARVAAPPPPDSRLEWPERQMCAPGERESADAEITFVAPASIVGFFRGTVAAYARPHEPLWKGLERLLGIVLEEWEGQPEHRDPIFRRDRYRCAVPACSSRRNLHDHHLTFRSRGGDNSRENRVVTCAWHHLRGIHEGRVRAAGKAPDEIVWELGAGDPDREPIMRLRGDRYLSAREEERWIGASIGGADAENRPAST